MVDTVRTLSALQTLLADNTDGDIGAQDIRDFLVSVYPKFDDWTPTLANITLGNGSLVARYAQLGTGTGTLVMGQFRFVLGSTSAVGTGPTFTLPVASKTYVDLEPLGQVKFLDAGTQHLYGYLAWKSTTTVEPYVFLANQTYQAQLQLTSTVPFTWGTNDSIVCNFWYEAG